MKSDEKKYSFDENDPFESMPLRLMMLVQVRCEALKNYNALDVGRKAAIEDKARAASCRIEKERLIDAVERGDFS
ncbi:MAG: hypothetical protein IKN38_06065 [Clostridia bacterium]|nr:hypothetical protein [Clostridia bacterium]